MPTMCDEVVIVEKSGSLYLGGPPLVKAATGEDLTSEELGGARVHCSISGCTDHFAASEQAAFEMTRGIVASLNLSRKSAVNEEVAQPPAYDSTDEEFAGLIPETLEEKWPMLEVREARNYCASNYHVMVVADCSLGRQQQISTIQINLWIQPYHRVCSNSRVSHL